MMVFMPGSGRAFFRHMLGHVLAQQLGQFNAGLQSMFSVHANGLDLGVYFDSHHFSIGLFGGANFGGWILIKSRHGAKPVYYHFDYAGYAGAKACLEF